MLIHALPIFHTHGLFVATNVTLFSGASMIFLPKFDVHRIFELMPRATVLMGVPTFYVRLLEDEMLNAETTVLPPLELPEGLPETDGSDTPPPEVVEAIASWKRRFIKGAVASVLVTMTGAGGAAAAMDKSVTVEIDGTERTVEAYAIDRVGLDLYGLHVAVDFLAYVRGQAKFDTLEALLEQMAEDVKRCRELVGTAEA